MQRSLAWSGKGGCRARNVRRALNQRAVAPRATGSCQVIGGDAPRALPSGGVSVVRSLHHLVLRGHVMAEIIQRRKLYQEVVDRLMERIRSGEIAPGAQLPSERELMEIYGVGRPAIREALQTLERSGIVEIVHGERAR